jgi:hypothetical protein
MGKPQDSAVATKLLRRPYLWAALGLLVAFELIWLFEGSALTPQNSDNLQAVLEVSDILRGNVLLHGWVVALQNYYFTDLPFFLATRLLFGHDLLAIYAAPFLIYLLLLLAAGGVAWTATHDPRDRAVALAALVFYLATPGQDGLAPLIFVGTQHVATLGFCLLAWFALDRIVRAGTLGAARNVRVLYVVSVFVALFSDPLTDVVFLAPTIIGLLMTMAMPRLRSTALGLIGLTVAAFVAAHVVMLAFRAAGGFATVFPEPIRFVAWEQFGGNVAGVMIGLMRLSGADFFGQPLMSADTILALLRLFGIGVIAAAMVVALRRCLGRAGEWRLSFVLALAALVQLASCLLSEDYADSLHSVAPLRFLLPVVIFGGMVAALELPAMLRGIAAAAPRFAFAGLGAVALVIAVLGFAIEGAARWDDVPVMARAPGRTAGDWLIAHQLTRGVGGYWEGMQITALSEEQVAVRAVFALNGRIRPYIWVAKPSWYGPPPQFAIYKPINPYGITQQSIAATYGPPGAIEHVAGYDIAIFAPTK